MEKPKRIHYTLFPALFMIFIALIPLMGILSEIINLTSLLFFIIEIVYVIALFLLYIINVMLCISLIITISKDEEISNVRTIFTGILIVLFSVIVLPYFYYKHVLKKPMKVFSLLLYLISIVFLTFVFAFGFNTKIKMAKEKEKYEEKVEKQRLTILEKNNLFSFDFKIGFEKQNVGEYDLYVIDNDRNIVFSEYTYDISKYEQKTLEDYLLKGVSDIESTRKNAKVYEEKKLTEKDDRKEYTISYEGNAEKSDPCIYKITVVQFNANPNYMVYTVSITLKDDYLKYKKELNEIISSIKFVQNNETP